MNLMQLECGNCGKLFMAKTAALVDRERSAFYCSTTCFMMRLYAVEAENGAD